MALVNMKGVVPADTTLLGGVEPSYPSGLCLHLGEDEISKLGLIALPAVGEKMELCATVQVERIESNESAGQGKRRSLSLQITDMELSAEGKEGEDEKSSMGKVLYDFDEVG